MTPTEQKRADEQDALMDTIKMEDLEETYLDRLNGPTTWEDTLDGLGLEDFPERDKFMEAGQLLRDAGKSLRVASCLANLNNPLESNLWNEQADRIENFLKGR